MTEKIEHDLLRRVRSELCRWYAGGHRDLPWRKTRDPYAIWISEIMLQQTRVETVVGYFERWMDRFGDVESLAKADIHDVLAVWQGLGYYSRARNLHAAANEIVTRHGGVFPSEPEQLAALRGVGRYTTGAIASIAFDRPVPLVDGNVARVFSRLFAIDLDPKLTAAMRKHWALAAELVQGERPGDLNQALMELGATVCTPRQAKCSVCPVADDCRALAAGRVDELPPRAKKPAQRIETRVAIVARDDLGRVWLGRRELSGLLGGLWEFPMSATHHPDEAVDVAVAAVAGRRGRALAPVVHVFSHIRMTVVPVIVEGGQRFAKNLDGYEQIEWIDEGRVDELPSSRLMKKLCEIVAGQGQLSLG